MKTLLSRHSVKQTLLDISPLHLSNLLLIPFVLLASKISCGNECQNLIIRSVKNYLPQFVLNQLPYNLICCPYFMCYEIQRIIVSYSSVPCHSLFYILLSYPTTCSLKLMSLVLFNFSFYRSHFISLSILLHINYFLLDSK